MDTKKANNERKMNIKSLAKTDFETIFKAFNQAFADYEIQLNREQLQSMWKRRGFNPDLSFAAFEGGDIVAFTLNGIGDFNGIPTAYDTGTGTLKTHRGQGLATEIFEYSLPYLREANIKQYLLEVLQHNTKAVSVYRNLGFEVTREFNYFVWKNEDLHNEIKNTDLPYSIEQIEIEKHGSVSGFWDFHPSWQNSFESIERAHEDFVGLGVFVEKKLVGYCVFEPASGDITQLAVNEPYRRKGIASLLLREIAKLNKIDTTKLVNTDISCIAMTNFFKAKNIAITGKQFEMVKKIE
jgi:ribosomal protein S18 acetylase RimI-like enzyme